MLLPAVASAAPTPPLAQLGLREVVRYAVDHSPRLDTAAKEATLATLTRRNAFAGFLPTIELNANVGRRGFSPAVPEYTTTAEGTLVFQSNNPWTSSLSVVANETLFDNFQTIDRYKIALLREEQAGIQALENRDQVFLEISQAFYQYSLDRKQREITEDQFDVLQKQFKIVSDGYRQGLKTRKDYLRFRSELNRFEIDLRRARSTLDLSKEALYRLIGAPADAPPFDFLLDESAPSLKELPPIPIEQHRQYRIANLDLEAQGHETSITRRRQWPELSLTAGATYNNNDFVGNQNTRFSEQDTLSYSVGLGLTYSILDWGVRRREAEAAAIQESITANSREDTLLRTREDITKLRVEYGQLIENFRLSKELLDLENQNLNTITTDYRQGRVEYLDYITSLRDRATARQQYYTTLYDLKKSQLNFRYHQGTLYEAIFNE